MDKVESLLNDIEKKAKKLLAHNERLQAENRELRERIFSYLQKIESYSKEISQKRQEVGTSKMIEVSTIDKVQLRKEIDKYIYLIEKCISSIHITE